MAPPPTFFDELKWDWCVSGDIFRKCLLDKILPPRDDLQVDRIEFLNFFSWSLSLSAKEKDRVRDAWPELTQFQCDELKIVYMDERKDFVALLAENRALNLLRLLFEAAESSALLVYGDSRTAESWMIEALNQEISGVKSLPFDSTLFPRNSEFFRHIAAMLLTFGAPQDISQRALEIARKKHKEERNQYNFFEAMLKVLPTTGNTIEQTRNIIGTRVDMFRQLLSATRNDESRIAWLIYHARDLIALKRDKQALTCLKKAYGLSKLNPEKTERTISILRETLYVRAHTFYFLEDLPGPECIFTNEEWADITPEVYEKLRPAIGLRYFVLGQCRLAFDLFQEHVANSPGEAFNALSVGVYIGNNNSESLINLFVTEVQPTLDRLLGDAAEMRLSGNRDEKHMIDYAKYAFDLWMRFISSPDKETKITLDRIYDAEYTHWLSSHVISLPVDALSWDKVYLGQIFQQVVDGLPLQTDLLAKSVTTTDDRLFVLDNLYIAASLFESRAERTKARQLAQVAREIYGIKEDRLLGAGLAITKKFGAFSERCDTTPPVFAGQPSEVKKFEGTWTLEQFKEILFRSKK